MTFGIPPPDRKPFENVASINVESLSKHTSVPAKLRRFICHPNFDPSFELLALPIELRFEILEYLFREYTENGLINIKNFENFPAIMRASHQLFIEARRIWSNQPLYFHKPLGMNVTDEAIRQANGVHAIYGAKPRFVVMRVPVVHHFVYTTKEEMQAGFETVTEECSLHPGSHLMMGTPVGQTPPPVGRSLCVTYASYKNWTARFSRRNRAFSRRIIAQVIVRNLLPIFSWWKLARIVAVGELFTLNLVGIDEWMKFYQPHSAPVEADRSTWICAITSALTSIIEFGPNVPKIKITGLGGCITAFLALWESIPRDFKKWHGGHSLLLPLVGWPYPEMITPYELVDDGTEAGFEYRRCVGNRLGVHETRKEWIKKVWAARFERYEWEFAA
jgi:hypothetical protein